MSLHFRRWASCSLLRLLLTLSVTAPASAQATVSIHDIMTELPNSPLLGQNVSTSGIVVGVIRASGTGNGGFYISLATYDNDTNTAEGVFVAALAIPRLGWGQTQSTRAFWAIQQQLRTRTTSIGAAKRRTPLLPERLLCCGTIRR